MSDTMLLRHMSLDSNNFDAVRCQDVFAFREFGPEDSEELKQEVGIVCGRVAFEERMEGQTNIRAFIYEIFPTRVIRYVFSTRDDMDCMYNRYTRTYSDPNENYYAYNLQSNAQELTRVSESTALQQQFSRNVASMLCTKGGLWCEPKWEWKPSGIYLQYYKPDQHHFRLINCTGTYAFREFHYGDMDRDLLNQGLYCSRDKFYALLNSDSNYHAITYYTSAIKGNASTIGTYNIYHTVNYVFASFSTLDCAHSYNEVLKEEDLHGYTDASYAYTNNRHYGISTIHSFVNESTAITSQFGAREAYDVCNYHGVLPFSNTLDISMAGVETRVAISGNTMLGHASNYTMLLDTTMPNTVPVSEMEVLSSVATVLLASPVLLAPVILAIHNVCDMFFDGLANWLTNLGRKK